MPIYAALTMISILASGGLAGVRGSAAHEHRSTNTSGAYSVSLALGCPDSELVPVIHVSTGSIDSLCERLGASREIQLLRLATYLVKSPRTPLVRKETPIDTLTINGEFTFPVYEIVRSVDRGAISKVLHRVGSESHYDKLCPGAKYTGTAPAPIYAIRFIRDRGWVDLVVRERPWITFVDQSGLSIAGGRLDDNGPTIRTLLRSELPPGW